MTETREGTDVVERLRALARHEHSDLSIGHEAADIIDVHRKTIEIANAGWNKDHSELTRLRSENEALKEALRPFFDGFSYDPGHSDLDNEQPISVRVQLGDWRRARRHLTARKEGQGGGA